MAKPLAFSIRLRDKGRTLRVRQDRQRYVVEDARAGSRTRRREHASLSGAIRDAACTWRERLH
jgi:hypothetical protein